MSKQSLAKSKKQKSQDLEWVKETHRHQERMIKLHDNAKQAKARTERQKKQEKQREKKAAERKHKKELDQEYVTTMQRMQKISVVAADYIIMLQNRWHLDSIKPEMVSIAHEYDQLRKKIGQPALVAPAEKEYKEFAAKQAIIDKKKACEEKIAKLKEQGYDENMRPLRPEDCITNPLDVENLNKPDMSLGEVMTDPQKDQVFITAKPKRLTKIEKFLARAKKQEDIISKWNQDHPDDQIEYDHTPIEKAKAYWKQIRNLLSVSTKERNREMDRWNSDTIPFATIPQFTYVKGYSPMLQLIDLYSGNVDAAKARFQKEMSRKHANGSGLPKEPLDGTPEIENHWQVASNIGVVTIRGGHSSVRNALAREYTDPRDLGIDPSEISDDREKIIKSAGESALNKGEN